MGGIRNPAEGSAAAMFAVWPLADVTEVASCGTATSCTESVSNAKKYLYIFVDSDIERLTSLWTRRMSRHELKAVEDISW